MGTILKKAVALMLVFLILSSITSAFLTNAKSEEKSASTASILAERLATFQNQKGTAIITGKGSSLSEQGSEEHQDTSTQVYGTFGAGRDAIGTVSDLFQGTTRRISNATQEASKKLRKSGGLGNFISEKLSPSGSSSGSSGGDGNGGAGDSNNNTANSGGSNTPQNTTRRSEGNFDTSQHYNTNRKTRAPIQITPLQNVSAPPEGANNSAQLILVDSKGRLSSVQFSYKAGGYSTALQEELSRLQGSEIVSTEKTTSIGDKAKQHFENLNKSNIIQDKIEDNMSKLKDKSKLANYIKRQNIDDTQNS